MKQPTKQYHKPNCVRLLRRNMGLLLAPLHRDGKGKDSKIPDSYKKIRVHLVFDIKHVGRHKARLVSDGHLTDVPLDSVYSGMASLRGLRIVLLLAELNNLQLCATYIEMPKLRQLLKKRSTL